MWDADADMEGLGQIAVRVDQAEAEAGHCILARHVQEQGRLAGAGLTDDV